MTDTILIAGATGGVGQQLVAQARAAGQPVRVLTRSAERARALWGGDPGVEIVPGDTTRLETLTRPVTAVRAVICATGADGPAGPYSPEHVDYEGVRNLVLSARAAGVGYFVLVSSIAVTHPEHPLNKFGQVLTWKLRGEAVVRTSGLPYTIVRPGGLTDAPGGRSALRLDQGDRITGRVSRADVATVCLQALRQERALNTTFEMVAVDGRAPEAQAAWDDLFAALAPDRVET